MEKETINLTKLALKELGSTDKRMKFSEVKENEKFRSSIDRMEVAHASGTGNGPKALSVTF